MNPIQLNVKTVAPFIDNAQIASYGQKAAQALKLLHSGKGLGADFLGWMHLPSEISEDLLQQIEAICLDWNKDIELVVVIGIGGSYLGAKAVIEALSHSFAQLMPSKTPRIVFAGQNISEDYLCELEDIMQSRSVGCVVISKSGTTTEPAIAFRMVKQFIENQFGKEQAQRRIVAITDRSRGALRTLATQEGYRSFVIPDNVGGRFSVFTPVGLLPIALAGIDIRALLKGALEMEQSLGEDYSLQNPAILYAATRNALYDSGKKVELLVNFHPKLHFVTEWWKQLYGESEGKDHKGIFPAGVDFTTDLHSMGQYIQDGERHLFETVISIQKSNRTMEIGWDQQNLDGLNYIAGKRVDHCNKMAELGTRLAHVDGGVPNLLIEMPMLDAYHLGALLYFFEIACGISGYVLGVNPFNQEGVEAYKKNMFALLGKDGYQQKGEELRKRLS